MFVLGVSAVAQESSESTTSATRPALVTDRPDVAESAVTVGCGTVQMETGVSYSREAGVGTVSFPTLLRFGVTQAWELRVESDMVALRNPG